jgi:hypothetical protein
MKVAITDCSNEHQPAIRKSSNVWLAEQYVSAAERNAEIFAQDQTRMASFSSIELSISQLYLHFNLQVSHRGLVAVKWINPFE